MTWLKTDQIELASGRSYNFIAPEPESITIEDIAHGLSNTCRFGGHAVKFYSVAEHSVLVSQILEAGSHDPDRVLAGLLHDAHETYVGDTPSPMKPLLGGAYESLADCADLVIAEVFGLDVDLFKDPFVKAADTLALFHEGNLLMPRGPGVPTHPLPVGLGVHCWEPDLARENFLDRYSNTVVG